MAPAQMTFPIEPPAANGSDPPRPTDRVVARPAPVPAPAVPVAPTLRAPTDPPAEAEPARAEPFSADPRPSALDVPAWQWWSALLVVLLVGVFAAIVSFGHIWAVADEAGEKWAALMFVPVDGMAIAASMTMSVRRRAGLKAGLRAWATFLLGVGASLAFNVAAAEPTAGARLISALPCVSFLLTYELLMQLQHIKARGGPGSNRAAVPEPSKPATGGGA